MLSTPLKASSTTTASLRVAASAAAASAIRTAGYASVARASIKSPIATNVVSTDDKASQASVLTIALATGSRAEQPSQRGIAHHLKNWAFQSTKHRTALRIARETEILGGALSTSLTREHLFLTAEFLRKDLYFFMDLLADVAYNTAHNPYEANNVNHLISVESDRAFENPEAVINEALHKVAFRAGLGNSLFAIPRNVNTADVKKFGQSATSFGNKIAIVGSGVDASELEQVSNAVLSKRFVGGSSGEVTTQPSNYFGGESRIDASSSEGHVAVAYPTGPLNSAHDFAAQVLKAHLGGEPATKYGLGASPLSKVGSKTSASIKSFAFNYSDAGLFGVRIRSADSNASAATKGAVEEIKKAAEGISADDFKKAVARAKLNAVSALESKISQVEFLGAQALGKGEIHGVAEVLSKLDSVKAADVSKLAATMTKSKPSVVAYGNTFGLPYADSL